MGNPLSTTGLFQYHNIKAIKKLKKKKKKREMAKYVTEHE